METATGVFNDTFDLYQFITNLQGFSDNYNRTIEALARYARNKFESYNS
ncbi:hypothetical protein PB1A_0786 [Leuconostoc inhae]|uniref:Uncharacterized protein n=2 Tax=Leuconostoc TaxID=1243 RepID=A0AAN2UFZ7_9LACO|nr:MULTISPECIES: hypothetical protein [Leuconostoc]MBM7435730.1 hypothetical protein [Leuconostoc rapi]MBZ5958938.1 hypothetical protein [Leuconostoc gasicomitatum]MBZ5981490.1 hypothetical protein [Leuconostoc gasicomitatum]MBZ5982028.1 hypothetical protein [Leuconostoc gasicomitatum]MBZ5987718.1 hypothetical protein [Leuconostoc gasicomitatum]